MVTSTSCCSDLTYARDNHRFGPHGDRRAKGTHLGPGIGAEKGPTVVDCRDFQRFAENFGSEGCSRWMIMDAFVGLIVTG